MRVRRSVSSSIVAWNSSTAAGDQSTSRSAEAGDRRLDRRQWRAQVVRHRLQERRPQGVGGGEVGGPPGLALQPLPLCRRGDLGGERIEHPLVLAREGAAGERQDHPAADVAADVGRVRAIRRLGSRRRQHLPARPGAPQQRRGTERERRPQLPEHLADRAGAGQRTGERGQRLGLGLQPRRPQAAAPDAIDEDGDDAGSGDVQDQRQHVLHIRDVEAVERRHEVPVGEQEPADHGGAGGQHATDERHDHRQHDVQEQHAREPERVAQVGQGDRDQRQPDGGDDPAPQLPTRRQRGEYLAHWGQAPLGAAVAVARPRDDMDVDRPGPPYHPVDHRAAPQLAPSRAVTGTEHDLRSVLRSGEVDEGGGDVVARDPPVLPAELLEQPPLGGHHLDVLLVALRESGVGNDMDTDQLALGALGDAGGAADEVVGVRCAGEGHDDSLSGLPRPGDAVTVAVVLQRVVDSVGHPQQGQLAQCRQVAGPEVVGQRGVDLVGAVHVAVGQPTTQRLRRHVHQLDVVGGPHHMVRDRFTLMDAGDPLDDVVQRLEVLHVHSGDHIDAGGEQIVDVLPALLVLRARRIGVGQLVDERQLRPPAHDGVGVHLRERASAIPHRPAGHDLELADLLGRPLPPVRLDEADHDIRPPLPAPTPLVEHGEGLADARRGAEVDAQLAALGRTTGLRHRCTMALHDASETTRGAPMTASPCGEAP